MLEDKKASAPPAAEPMFFGDPYGTRTHVTAVKGRCLNHLTNGPKKKRSEKEVKCCAFLVAAPGFEPGTLRV